MHIQMIFENKIVAAEDMDQNGYRKCHFAIYESGSLKYNSVKMLVIHDSQLIAISSVNN